MVMVADTKKILADAMECEAAANSGVQTGSLPVGAEEAITSRLTTAQVLAAYVNLGEIIKRQSESYDMLLVVPPAKVRDHLQAIKDNASAAIAVCDRLGKANK